MAGHPTNISMPRRPDTISAMLIAVDRRADNRDPDRDQQSSGRNQALERWTAVLAPWFDERILVTTRPLAYLDWEDLILVSSDDGHWPLSMIRTGLRASSNPMALVADLNFPPTSPEDINRINQLLHNAEQRWDIITTGGKQAPVLLPAIYNKRCEKIIDRMLVRQTVEAGDFFRNVRGYSIRD
jgi:molybdopterin-guanine dinucleotide biosynthesis protein A